MIELKCPHCASSLKIEEQYSFAILRVSRPLQCTKQRPSHTLPILLQRHIAVPGQGPVISFRSLAPDSYLQAPREKSVRFPGSSQRVTLKVPKKFNRDDTLRYTSFFSPKIAQGFVMRR
jgi:hypothetical protein